MNMQIGGIFYICSYILFFVLLRGGKCDTIVDSTCDFFNIGNWSLNITCKYSICYALGFELGLTARGSDADRFWFSLFHEFGHIILVHIGNIDGTTDQDENAADEWARDKLIPAVAFNKFKENQVFSLDNVSAFAKSVGIAPGIVVGRLQNERKIQYNMLNELKEHYAITM